MKSNTMHDLDKLATYGSYPLEYYKPLMNEVKYQECLNRRVQTWYPLSVEMMVSFLYAEDIAETAEEAITLYKAETLVENQKGPELQKRVDAAVAKEKNDKSKWFHKLAAVANTAHGPEFLDEVSCCL